MTKLKSWLKQFPMLVIAKRRMWSLFDESNGVTTLDLLAAFPLFIPYSAGSYKGRAGLTVQAINQIFPFLRSLAQSVHGRIQPVEDIAGVPRSEQEQLSAQRLKERLDFHGSDKANHHNYHHLYGSILSDRESIRNIFEIGLGTNNTDVVSHMGQRGRPGASLRAFRDHCPNAMVHGADVDRRILFQEDRIQTHFVDQTDPASFEQLKKVLPGEFDLVIDDGLHSPNANVESLNFGLAIVKKGGWVVIEDIATEALALWQVVAALLPPRYSAHVIRAEGAMVFAVQRLD